MLARTYSATLLGVEGHRITVEAEVSLGLPSFTLVGQASGALYEARERVKSALGHCGHSIPPRKQVVNLAPAELRKDSPGLDLAVACALLASHGVIERESLESTLFWGELALDGTLRPVAGTLVVADCARKFACKRIIVPQESVVEAALIPGLEVRGVHRLDHLVAALRGEAELIEPDPERRSEEQTINECVAMEGEVEMSDVRGLGLAKLGIAIMVAGGHNLLMHGPPGVGKTMIAKRASHLFPALDKESALEVTKIYSSARRHDSSKGLIRRAPFRMPHHSISPAGLLGGGNPPRLGELSMAHRGLLFLDELPEFSRVCLEGLREPIEEGSVRVVRAQYALTFPARFQLMAAMNPCPCGFFGHSKRSCTCSVRTIQRYQQRISGPFTDRMDLIVPVTSQDCNRSTPQTDASWSSFELRRKIRVARERQFRRFSETNFRRNSDIPAIQGAMEKYCVLSTGAEQLLKAVVKSQNLSLRVQHRLRRVARTYCDMREDNVDDTIDEEALAIAVQLRRLPQI